MSEVSNLDLLERKIGETLAKLAEAQQEKQAVSRRNDALERRIGDLEDQNKSLKASFEKLKREVAGGGQDGRQLASVREKVQGILAKFELLDL